MPVYLVVFTKLPSDTDSAKQPGLFEAWNLFIRGEVFHVELAFVNVARPVYGYSITYPSKVSRYGTRIYDEKRQKASITWYEVPDVDEKKCEAYCVKNVGKDKFSMMKTMQSAMPFKSEWVGDVLIPITTGVVEKDRPTVWQRLTQPTVPLPENSAYCATTTLKALKAGTNKLDDVKEDTCTGTDVVCLVLRRLGAVLRDTPPENKPAVRRSTHVVSVHHPHPDEEEGEEDEEEGEGGGVNEIVCSERW